MVWLESGYPLPLCSGSVGGRKSSCCGLGHAGSSCSHEALSSFASKSIGIGSARPRLKSVCCACVKRQPSLYLLTQEKTHALFSGPSAKLPVGDSARSLVALEGLVVAPPLLASDSALAAGFLPSESKPCPHLPETKLLQNYAEVKSAARLRSLRGPQ
ncbi:uncharacterized protein CCR75_009024 [Bremia lactucae]|uniref:Uncharacterized protein n=1 Tax=Bremia lactucae TaxID=4779 RepID=A0A976IBS6_BRELC|nr:hypothetical protein CCR75_009024 [Bremia lactucae]